MITAALQIALKRSRKNGSVCLHGWRQALYGALLMARRVPIVEICGVKVTVSREFSSKVLTDLYFADYETAEARMVVEKISERDVVLEFGGGLGLVSTLCAQRVGSDRVFCYEANPAMIQVIKDTYAVNGVAPTLTQGLLGSTDGVAELFVGEHFYSASAVSPPSGSKKVRVPSFAINPVIHRLRPTFLIMDIEGGERDLVPAIDFSGIRKVVIELHPATIGDVGVSCVRRCLTAWGFSVDARLSGEKVLFLERLL